MRLAPKATGQDWQHHHWLTLFYPICFDPCNLSDILLFLNMIIINCSTPYVHQYHNKFSTQKIHLVQELIMRKNQQRNFQTVGEILYLQEHIHGKQAMTVNRKNIFVVCRIWQCNLIFLINVLVPQWGILVLLT